MRSVLSLLCNNFLTFSKKIANFLKKMFLYKCLSMSVCMRQSMLSNSLISNYSLKETSGSVSFKANQVALKSLQTTFSSAKIKNDVYFSLNKALKQTLKSSAFNNIVQNAMKTQANKIPSLFSLSATHRFSQDNNETISKFCDPLQKMFS